MTQNWYLIQIKRNSYRLAERNLNQQGFATFLPLQDFTRRKGSKFLENLKPLFPGYMFVTLDLDEAPWQKINSTLGVSRLICQNGMPISVSTEIISALMSRCDNFGRLLPPTTLEIGDSVEIQSGVLANFVAKVETIDKNSRIWVLMDIMGRSTKVEVENEHIKLVN